MGGRLALRPDSLFKGTPQLGLVRLPDEVVALVIERRVQEEAVVLEREVLVGLADAALAERHQLLALGKRAHGDGPFLECDWHREGGVWMYEDAAPLQEAAHRTLPCNRRRLTPGDSGT